MNETEQDPNLLSEEPTDTTTLTEGDRPIIVQGSTAPDDDTTTSEGDRPIIVQGS